MHRLKSAFGQRLRSRLQPNQQHEALIRAISSTVGPPRLPFCLPHTAGFRDALRFLQQRRLIYCERKQATCRRNEVEAKTEPPATLGQPKGGTCPGLDVRPRFSRPPPTAGLRRSGKKSGTTAGAEFADTPGAAGKPRHAVAGLKVKAHHQPKHYPAARLHLDSFEQESERSPPGLGPRGPRTLPGSPCLDFLAHVFCRHGRLAFQRTNARVERRQHSRRFTG